MAYDSFTFVSPSVYKSPVLTNDELSIRPILPFVISLNGAEGSWGAWHMLSSDPIIVTFPDGTQQSVPIEGGTIQLTQGGYYEIQYSGSNQRQYLASQQYQTEQYKFHFTLLAIENYLPLKKWTATDVINRLLDLAQTLREGETPPYVLQGMNSDGTMQAGSQAALFDTILSPEFTFTKQTLRENLRQVGEIIHGEPRFTPMKDSSGNWYIEVSYDLYGQNTQWKHANRAYVKKETTQNVNTYSSSLDSSVENLVNKTGDEYGTITEPYAGGAKTMRTEQMYAQITEQNMIIPTQFPIYTVAKIEWIQNNNGTLQAYDITPYLFESSIYNTQLSSYDNLYPYSKAYGIMYTQGEKNITNLNFKPEHPISEIFENYSILNILRAASGNENLTIEEAATDTKSGSYTEGGYPQLAFRVTYTPIYQSRVAQTKANYLDYQRPAAMIYNQQANIVDSQAYGENMKGVIARFGNAEKSYTYRLSRLSQIPTPGMMFDADYTISAVYVEILSDVINCTIALTKNFNRISQYVGISSVKRYSQVSQTMALDRNVLYSEYIVIGDGLNSSQYTSGSRMGTRFLGSVAATFTQNDEYAVPLTQVTAWGETGEGNILPAVSLPVIASAFGNSIVFSWQYEDNYSAGAISSYQTGGTGDASVTGYYQDNYQYTDYYGKIYYYNFQISPTGQSISATNFLSVGNALPGVQTVPENTNFYISTISVGQTPYILRKDNREKLQVNYQINFVTNREGLIIGSALASFCPAIRGTDSSKIPSLYVFPQTINKFAENVRSLGINLSDFQGIPVSVTTPSINVFGLKAGTFPSAGKSWAICMPVTTTTEQVETETGQIVTQTITKGGEILLAQNMDISAGDTFQSITFTAARDVFNRSVWKDIQ